MTLSYFLRRVGMFFLVVWLAATVNFFLPASAAAIRSGRSSCKTPRPAGASRAAWTRWSPSTTINSDSIFRSGGNISTISGTLLHFDFNYSIINYPARVIDIIGARPPLDHRTPDHDDLPFLDHRQHPGRVHGLAAFAKIPRVRDASPALAQCDSLFPARFDPALSVCVPLALVPDHRRFLRRHLSRLELRLRLQCVQTFGPAGAVDHPGLDRLLGARHARDDGHHPARTT